MMHKSVLNSGLGHLIDGFKVSDQRLHAVLLDLFVGVVSDAAGNDRVAVPNR